MPVTEQDKAKHDGKPDRPETAAETAKAAEAETKARAEARKKHEAARAEAVKARQAATEARAKANEKEKTPEQKTAEEAEAKADDAEAKAAALHPDANPPTDAPAGSAVVRAPKLNVPGHPAYSAGVPTDDESQTVSLWHMSEDNTERVYTRVHPDMVGNYLRAGWSQGV